MIIFLYFFIVILWSLFLVEFLSDHMLTIGKVDREVLEGPTIPFT